MRARQRVTWFFLGGVGKLGAVRGLEQPEFDTKVRVSKAYPRVHFTVRVGPGEISMTRRQLRLCLLVERVK